MANLGSDSEDSHAVAVWFCPSCFPSDSLEEEDGRFTQDWAMANRCDSRREGQGNIVMIDHRIQVTKGGRGRQEGLPEGSKRSGGGTGS